MSGSCSVPVWEKAALTIEEAAAYSNIGIKRIRAITDDPSCDFVMWAGKKRLIKRELFDKFIDKSFSI